VTYASGFEILFSDNIFEVAAALKRKYKHNFKMPICIKEIELD